MKHTGCTLTFVTQVFDKRDIAILLKNAPEKLSLQGQERVHYQSALVSTSSNPDACISTDRGVPPSYDKKP
jgi:hypothetical protein